MSQVKWREVQAAVGLRCGQATVSVGRCYPLKNRFPDVLPYDHSRVVLTHAKDDYINASHVTVRDISASNVMVRDINASHVTVIDISASCVSVRDINGRRTAW